MINKIVFKNVNIENYFFDVHFAIVLYVYE